MNNRPIKLRFWDKEFSHWRELPDLYGDYQASAFRTYGDGFDIKHFLSGEAQGKIRDGILIIQQFTGLKDSTGKEIYEGDIVECNDGLKGRIYGEVVYDQEYGAFRIVFTDILQWTFYKVENPEVIGNIFETPELLA